MHPQKLRKLVRRWTLPVVALTVLGAVVAFSVSRTLTPVYEAKGAVLVVAGPQQSTNANSLVLNASQVTSTAAALMVEPPQLQKVIESLKLSDTTEQLAARITVTPERDTELVDVAVRDPDSQRAAQIANTLMTIYVSQVTTENTHRIDQAGAALKTQIDQLSATVAEEQQQLATARANRQDTTAVSAALSGNTALLAQLTLNYSTFQSTQAQNLETVSVAAPASVPTQTASPRILLNTLLGALAGLLLALGLAGLLEYLDQGLHSADDVRERLGVPCLGVVPRFNDARGQVGAKAKRHVEAASEAYRRLRTNLLFADPDTPLRSVVLTSARVGEGKTRTAANLAVALANSDKRVLLVDADLRRPSQHRLFNKTLEAGISDMIMTTRADNIPALNGNAATSYANLSVLTCGTIPPNPSELLASKRAHVLFKAFREQHDLVVIDTPPADVVTDALSLAADASATVVVVEAGKTNATQALAVIESLRSVGANVAGVVLNKARERSLASYYYQYGDTEAPSPLRGPAPPLPEERSAPVAEGGPVKVG